AVINQLNAGEGAPPPLLAAYTLQPIDKASTATTIIPISSIQQGQDFFLQMVVQDLRPDLFNNPGGAENVRGLFAAYTDVLYDKSLVTVAVSDTDTITVPSSATPPSFTL